MARACEVVRGGIHCGRTAKFQVGVCVPPHVPRDWLHLCRHHKGVFVTEVELLDDPDVVVEVVELGVSPAAHDG